MFSFTHKNQVHTFTIKDLIESYDECNDHDFLNIKDRRGYCDDEIMNFGESLEKNIGHRSEIKWVSVEPLEEEMKNFEKAEFRKYLFQNCVFENTHLIVIKTFEKEYYEWNEIIIFLTENSFKMVACLGAHPRVETEEFVFYNSDGSGPNLIEDIDDPDKIYEDFVKYYNIFINDGSH